MAAEATGDDLIIGKSVAPGQLVGRMASIQPIFALPYGERTVQAREINR